MLLSSPEMHVDLHSYQICEIKSLKFGISLEMKEINKHLIMIKSSSSAYAYHGFCCTILFL